MSTAYRVAAALSKDAAEARSGVLTLYRTVCRAMPLVLRAYEIEDVSAAQARSRVAQLFRQNATVSDTRTIDILRTKGEMELAETISKYKTTTQIYKIIDPTSRLQQRAPSTSSSFLDEFYATGPERVAGGEKAP